MRLWNRVRLSLARRRLQDELDQEMQAHREMLQERFVRDGMSPQEARVAAARAFGSEASNLEQSRDEWGFPWLQALTRDAKFAVRMLLRRPALTVAAVLTVGLGVGANTAIVSVLRTVLLNPLGLRNADPVMVATVRIEQLKMKGATTSGVEYRELQALKDAFSTVAAVEGRAWTSDSGGEPVRLEGTAVTTDFFRVFGERPAAGRFFVPEDQRAAVLSYRMWQTQFGGDASVLGKTLMLDGQPHPIVGVASQHFRFPASGQLWTSLTLPASRLQQRGNNMTLTLLARRRNDVTPEQAAERVNRYIDGVKSAPGGEEFWAKSGYFVDLTPFSHHVAGDLRQPLWLLWAAALVVLCSGCANIAALLLSRAAGRRKEMAVRLSMGATRIQILRQLLMESAALGCAGGLAGLAFAAGAIALLHRLSLPRQELLALVSLDGALIAYGLMLSLLSGLVFGLAPAVQLLRSSQTGALARAGRRRFQGVFVAAEVAAALLLVITTGLMLRTLWSLGQIQPGFETRNISTAYLLKPDNDPGFIHRLDQTLRSTAGAEATALAYPLPFSTGGLTSGFGIKGRERRPGEPEWHGEAYFVSPGFFRTLKIPLRRGRTFSDGDSLSAPLVCVIDARLAERFFPGQDPLGQEINMYRGWARIVGVVNTIRATTIDKESRPAVYYALEQAPLFAQAAVLVRSQTPAAGMIRDAVRRTNRSVAVFDVRSLEDRIAETLGIRRMVAILVFTFAAICVLLAAVGLNGTVSQSVGERAHEIAIRMALGARPGQVLRQFLRHGMAWGGLGLLLGLACAVYVQGLAHRIALWNPTSGYRHLRHSLRRHSAARHRGSVVAGAPSITHRPAAPAAI